MLSDKSCYRASCRILITGAKGMLGQAFVEQARRHFPNFEIMALGRDELDVTDPKQTLSLANKIKDSWIVHCAALVNVDLCERDPVHARNVIVEGTRNILHLAKAANARLFYPQSFLVYDGSTCPIGESDPCKPLSLYGKLKKESEDLALSTLDCVLTVKMAGFFGGEKLDKNFVGKFIPYLASLVAKGEKSVTVGNRVWQPTFTEDLALNSLGLIALKKSGSYQMASHGQCSFAELAQEIISNFKWNDRIRVNVIEADKIGQRDIGRRPDRAILSCSRLTGEGLNLQRNWKDALREYLARPYFDQFRKLKGLDLEQRYLR